MKIHKISIALTLIVVSFCSCENDHMVNSYDDNLAQRTEDKLYPAEGHILAQNYPEEKFALSAYRSSLANVKKQRENSVRFGNWKQQGPGNIGGRVNSIAVNPENGNEMLLGYSIGGVFKTQDNGETWEPLFDNEDILSISDITYDPNNPENIYVGTGDLNISGYPVTGNGIFKSTDGGNNWERKGLTDAGVIAEVGISKANSDIVYAASMGLPFERTENRGLYKSTDGGNNWEHVFYLNDSTGVIDIEVHPEDPNIVYAATWTRIRNNRESVIESDQAGIYKTIDGGESWVRLINGLPTGELVRPGLAMYESNPDIVFSMFVSNEPSEECSDAFRLEGIYKTVDEGGSWVQIPNVGENAIPCNIYRGFGWYFGQIRVNPIDENDIYILSVDLYNTKDGGENWFLAAPSWSTYEVHADKHDLDFNNQEVILATDGGAYRLEEDEWVDIENIVSTQFYRVATSNFDDNYYGGAQDNGSTGGTDADVDEWPRIFGGDGFQMLFHPTDPNIWYVETQNGGIRVTLDGGENYANAAVGLEGNRNWDMQYIMSSANPEVLYTGTDRVYRSESLFAPSWIPISENLTDTVDLSFARTHNITTLDESPVNTDYLYCGTSDGLVWRSLDLGNTWERINEGLPRRYISDIKTSRSDANTVYVTIQGYKDNDFTPYIYKSTNNGDTWESINGNLPQIAINDILLPEDDVDDMKIFAATDGGVYYTEDAGISWIRLGDDMPILPVYDLAIGNSNELVAGTFARGIYTYDLAQLENVSSEGITISRIHLYPTVTESQFTIEGLVIGDRVDVVSSQGQILKSDIIKSAKHNLDISNLPIGQYFVRPPFGKAGRVVKI
ncbi:MAG: photosystem II stability/assembly factor-like uncharacterized protein [Saprospiraceae bacterium]|jgi:photosystem II stability/assembly factor-like uncharacterized protein